MRHIRRVYINVAVSQLNANTYLNSLMYTHALRVCKRRKKKQMNSKDLHTNIEREKRFRHSVFWWKSLCLSGSSTYFRSVYTRWTSTILTNSISKRNYCNTFRLTWRFALENTCGIRLIYRFFPVNCDFFCQLNDFCNVKHTTHSIFHRVVFIWSIF